MNYRDLLIGALMITGVVAQQEAVKFVEEQQPLAFDKKLGFEIEEQAREARKNPDKTVDHPAYVPYSDAVSEAVLFEQFTDSEDDIFAKWKTSHAKKAITDEKEEFSYVGEWAIEEATIYPGLKGDKGLVLKSPAAHHAISRRFDSVLDNTGKTLVVQYEVKPQQGLTCGGAYVKLLSDSDHYSENEFSNETPYEVMFGPDKCGATDKIHLIIRRKDPNTGEVKEHHLVAPPRTFPGTMSTLYTLILKDDQTYEIRVNGDVRKAGSLIEEGVLNPPLNPPKEIEDASEEMPEDWDEERYIPDPEQTVKPDDWDEDAPAQIPDPDAEIPEDWREDLEEFVVDPEATMPEDWDEEEDGEWEAPLIFNPECEEISGCGPWVAPLIRNPEFRGKWRQPLIDNPNYQGPWTPSMIPNPDYFEDSTPADLAPIAGIGLELWTMQSDILFNDFYIGHSVAEAEKIGNATFLPKLEVERAEYAANAPEPPEEFKMPTMWEIFKKDPLAFVQGAVQMFLSEFEVDKVGAFKHQPVAAGIMIGSVLGVFAIIFGIMNVITGLLFKTTLPTPKETKKTTPAADSAESTSAKTEKETVTKRK